MLAKKTSELAKAAFFGNIPQIRTLLSSGADINGLFMGGTGVWHAVSQNYFETVKYLVERGADLNVIGPNMSSPLHRAAHNNNFEIVQYLLENGAYIDKGNDSSTPLCIAVRNANMRMIEMLLEYRADTNKGNPISQAVLNGDSETLLLLLDNGANISKHDVEKLLKEKYHFLIIREMISTVTFCPPVRAVSLWKLKIKYEQIISKEARHTVNALDRELYELSKVILPFYAEGVSQAIAARKIISEYDLVILSQISTIYPPYKKILKPILRTFQDLHMLKQIHDDSVSVLDATNTTLAASLVLNGRCQKKLGEYLSIMGQSPLDESKLNNKAAELDQLVHELGTMCIHDSTIEIG